MSRLATRILGFALLASLFALPALANQYPPGPGGLCPDSLNVTQIQNAAASCHPAVGDSVYGVGGICTGFDTKTSGVGFYMQISGGGPWSGVDVFTANTNWPFARGDSVVVEYGQVTEFSQETEITALNGSFGTNMFIRKVSSGHALPPFHVGTVNEFNLPNSNTASEQWEGTLVRVSGNLMRVARTTGVGATNFVVVDNVVCPTGTVGTCDSVFVDGTTLANPSVAQPALGTMVQWVQGIYGQASGGYRIRLRDADDYLAAVPPGVSDAYSVANDTIRVVFDRDVTTFSAQNVNNYSLASFGTVLSARLEADSSSVDLAVNNGLSPGDNESVTVNGIVSKASGVAMTTPASRTFANGVLPITTLQAPDPASLAAVPCVDRSSFAGTGSTPGIRLTVRGTCVATLPGSLYYLEMPSGVARSGVTVYGYTAAGVPTVGHSYMFVGQVQEYFGETELVAPVYMRDEGVGGMPAPAVRTVAVLRDSTCDAGMNISNGEDYEGMLVKVNYVKTVSDPLNPGDGFDVAGPNPTFADTIHINNRQSSAWTYQGDSLMVLDITGIERFDFGQFVISPRSNADFLEHGYNVGVTPTDPTRVSFAVAPNPSRSPRVSFALPRAADVDLAVFDLSGRKVATLAKGAFLAGSYTRDWNGNDAAGNAVGSGVYFVRLRVGSENYSLRAVRVN